jgi:hypothetical protein
MLFLTLSPHALTPRAEGALAAEQAQLAAAAGVSSEQLLLWRQQGRAWLSQIDKDMSRWGGWGGDRGWGGPAQRQPAVHGTTA